MPKQLPYSELDSIKDVVSCFPEGVSLGKIVETLKGLISRRNIQYRLAFLVKNGDLIAIGNARARIYLLPQPNKKNEVSPKEADIPLSFISKDIESKINQSIILRTPVGYNRNFLDLYRPNTTRYLPDSISQKLFELGKTDGERPAGTYAREIFNRLLIDLSWNSSRLEGNTYSLLETERLLELSEAAEGKELSETQMILNHKAAIEFLVESAETIDINRSTILNLHALLSDNLLADPMACGRLRSKSIGIAKSVYHPLVVPDVIDECFEQVIDTAKAIRDPFEQSFFLMVHLPYLQPFEDVNKRVSRLVANIPLIRLNLAPLSFMDVPQKTYTNGLLAVYELNSVDLLRDVFLWAYERSCALYSATRQTLGEPDPFRLRHRSIILETVVHVVHKKMNKKDAVEFIRSKAKDFTSLEDQAKFVEKIEIELRGLHEGNIARYRLRPSEYEQWQINWK